MIRVLGIKRGSSRKLGIPVIALLCFLIIGSFISTSAIAETESDIVARADAEFSSGKSVLEVISSALSSAEAVGIPSERIAQALADALMDAGIRNGADGSILAGQIASGMLLAVTAAGADTNTTLRTVSETVLGIRAASESNGLDAATVESQVLSALSSNATTAELGTQLANVAAAALAQTRAETYTPPATPQASVPPAPSTIPSDVQNAYDPTASPSST
ncbi:MAG: hypothetical protein LLG06_08370 [Desulfobacteraceae bacterium]|nr:hypothetical protein [Desulfobacteraceae bacterium]